MSATTKVGGVKGGEGGETGVLEDRRDSDMAINISGGNECVLGVLRNETPSLRRAVRVISECRIDLDNLRIPSIYCAAK